MKTFFLWSCLTLVWGSGFLVAETLSEKQMTYFEKHVRPVFETYCMECHSAQGGTVEGGLNLDSAHAWKQGGESGPVIVEGKPQESLLIKAVRRFDQSIAMPPKKELPLSLVRDLEVWIEMGAPDPREAPSASPVVANQGTRWNLDEERQKWIWKFPVQPSIPFQEEWGKEGNPIDHFVLEKLKQNGLSWNEKADARTLIRRLSYDLTGLPPSPAQVQDFQRAFIQDSKNAVSLLVDRLLASPQYGEKWGRHWLDLVRYADSLDARGRGKSGDFYLNWKYRDWVVNAFNTDLPYDDFVKLQIAGDILAEKDGNVFQHIPTSVYAMGEWGNGDSDKKLVHTNIVDDQIDLTGRAFMGLTLSCARCHDHKFDPISTRDYYGLAGFFFSSRILERFNPPTAGEVFMEIPLLTSEERKVRQEKEARLNALKETLKKHLVLFDETISRVAEIEALEGWKLKGEEGASLLVHRGEMEAKFGTIILDPRVVSVHPAPDVGITVLWESPSDGEYHVKVSGKDADPNGGDGVHWHVEAFEKVLAEGAMSNGGSFDFETKEVLALKKGDRVGFCVKPGGNYTFDTTMIDFVVTSLDSQTWDLRKDLLAEPSAQRENSPWKFGRGESTTFPVSAGIENQEFQALAEALKTPPERTHGLREGGILGTPYEGFHDVAIHHRGDYDRLGEKVPRGFPEIFSSNPPVFQGSGRLALAEWMTSPEHPLTARVIANRVWAHHFQQGIVQTPNNFGHLGSPPTHPELLDWLAVYLMENGWSLKQLHRLICTSETYLQSSSNSAERSTRDPDNQLFSRQNRRKLTAEELRDTLLVLSEQLDLTSGGPAFDDLNVPRRTLYLETMRSNRSSFQNLFDGADSTAMVEMRTDSIVAPQALWMMNHPFVMDQVSKILNQMNDLIPDEHLAVTRLQWLYEKIFQREMHLEEEEVFRQVMDSQSSEGWLQVIHALLCTNELMFVD